MNTDANFQQNAKKLNNTATLKAMHHVIWHQKFRQQMAKWKHHMAKESAVKGTYRIGENIFKLYYNKLLISKIYKKCLII